MTDMKKTISGEPWIPVGVMLIVLAILAYSFTAYAPCGCFRGMSVVHVPARCLIQELDDR